MKKLKDLKDYTFTCPLCGNTTTLRLDEDQFKRFRKDGDIKSAFPRLSKTRRVVLMKGICPGCQEHVFGHEETPVNLEM